MTLLVVSFFALLALGVPIAFTIGCVGCLQLISMKIPLEVIPMQMLDGSSSYSLLAVPLFMLAGEFLSRSGLMTSLVQFADLLVGRFRGGMAHANILCSTFFAGISGSAIADVSALGPIERAAMLEAGYDNDYAAAVTASSSIQGPIIPPSVLMVAYTSVINISLAGLFMAGFVPGFLLAVSNMIVAAVMARKHNHPRRTHKIKFADALKITSKALPALMLPIIILGGIFSGVFTVTESAAVAVFYALILTVFITKTVKLKDIPSMLLETARLSTIALFIIAGAQLLGYIFAILRVPTMLTSFLLSITTNRWLIITMVTGFFLFTGMFMDTGATIVLFCPLTSPVLHSLGFHPYHVALFQILTITVGLITPPVGMCLYTASAVCEEKIENIVRALGPFLVADIAVVVLVTYVPDLVLVLPRLFGMM